MGEQEEPEALLARANTERLQGQIAVHKMSTKVAQRFATVPSLKKVANSGSWTRNQIETLH